MFPHTLAGTKGPYLGPNGENFPPQESFEPEMMGAERRREFELWWVKENEKYQDSPQLQYNIEEEALKYCRTDCTILREGKFLYTKSDRRKLWIFFPAFTKFLQAAAENCHGLFMLDYLTTPSYSFALFTHYYLELESIALLPPDSFGEGNSKSALAWMACQRKRLGLVSWNDGRRSYEAKIKHVKVDGYGRSKDGQLYVLMFSGCL